MSLKATIPSKILNAFDDQSEARAYNALSQHISGFQNAQSGSDDTKGGFSVPTILDSKLSNLVKHAGCARQNCRVVVMPSDDHQIAKVTDAVQVNYVSEGQAVPESDMTLDRVTLNSVKLATIVKYSSEISEDNSVNLVDELLASIAGEIAAVEDKNLFVGGGVGSINENGIAGDASVAAVPVASVAALSLENLSTAMAGVNWVRGFEPKWYVNPSLLPVIIDLANAAGNNILSWGDNGARLYGYPVELCSEIDGVSASTSGDLLAVFGDLRKAAVLGYTRDIRSQTLRQLYANNGQLALKVTSRSAIEVIEPSVITKVVLA